MATIRNLHSRRDFLKMAGLGTASAYVLAACAGATTPTTGGQTTTGPTAKTKVELWFPTALVPDEEGERTHTYYALLQEFNAQSADVEVEPLTSSWSGGGDKLVTAVAGGTPPDLFYLDRYIGGEFAARRVLEPLDAYIDASTVVKREAIWQELIKDVTYRGQTFGIPHYTDVRAFYWNKDIFAEVGLDPETQPQTWTEQLEFIDKVLVTDAQGEIDRLGYAPSIGNPPGFLMWYIFLWQLGGEFMNEEKTQVTFNNEAGVGAMQWIVDTFDAQGGIEKVEKFASALTPGVGQDIFMIGKMGMQVNGDWVPTLFDTYVPDLNWGVGFIPIPEGGQKANYHGGHAWVIPTGARNKDAAWKFIEWMLMPEHQLRAALGENNIPALEALAESPEYLDAEPAERVPLRHLFVEEFKVAKWVPTIPGVGEILGANIRGYDSAIRHVMSAAEAVATMADECQKIMDDWQERIQEQAG